MRPGGEYHTPMHIDEVQLEEIISNKLKVPTLHEATHVRRKKLHA